VQRSNHAGGTGGGARRLEKTNCRSLAARRPRTNRLRRSQS